ncbi:hypothetical protein HKW97_25015 (plasmid) [Pseudomonas luteola]|uniref:hypothetical protein n=1 Tax=Pseudomonas luteola TaxID=47886 RepID=UPI003890A0BD
MKNILCVIALMILNGCVGIHTEFQQSKISHATDTYHINGSEHLWSESEHPKNGRVTLESEQRWCGVTLWAVILPVPLKLPVCKEYIKVEFENNMPVTRKKGWVSIDNFYACGPGVWLISGFANGKEKSFCIAD